MVTRKLLWSLAAWGAVAWISWLAFERGIALGGTAEWAGLLHPLLFGLTLWPVLRSAFNEERWVTLPNGILFLTYVMVGLGSVYYVVFPMELGLASLHQAGVVRETLLVVLAGVLAFRIGAWFPWVSKFTRRIPPFPKAPRWSNALRVGLFAILLLAVAFKGILMAQGTYGYQPGDASADVSGLNSILFFVSDGGLVAFSVGFFYWFGTDRLRRSDKIAIGAAVLFFAGFTFLSGMKRELLDLGLHVAVPYLLAKYQLDCSRETARWRGAGFAVALVAIPAVFALNPLYRAELVRRGADENRLTVGVHAARTAVSTIVSDSRSDAAGVLADGARRLWERTAIFPFTAAVVSQVPERVPHRGVSRYASVPLVSAVPRALWPDKPVNEAGVSFQRRLITTDVFSSTNPTVYGWAYWDGGVGAVVVMLLLFGSLTRLFDDYLVGRNGYVLPAVVFYAVAWRLLFNIESDPFWASAGLPNGLAVAAFAYISIVHLPRLLAPGRISPVKPRRLREQDG